MIPKEWRSTAYVLAAVSLAAGLWLALAKEGVDRRAVTERERQAQTSARIEQLKAQWATVIRDKELEPGERIRLLQVPDPELGLISRQCLIYTNTFYRTAQLVCDPSSTVSQ